MSTYIGGVLKRPPPDADTRARSSTRPVGILLGIAGLAALVVALVANVVATSDLAGDPAGAAEILAWSFGVTTSGLALAKLGIAAVLVGIIWRLWTRVDAVTEVIGKLRPDVGPRAAAGSRVEKTGYGPATVTDRAPKSLPIHKLATAMWLPMLAMGAMAVAAGLVTSIAQSNEGAGTELYRQLAAWTQGLQFLGEGLILAGIAFLLGTILYSLRRGGGDAQQTLGVAVKTLRMPATAKAFIGLMMLGVMAAVGQFVLYVVVAVGIADDPADFATWTAWLGPVREVALGLLLASIVLALVTIGSVLGFQFGRLREIVRTGR